MPDTFKLKSMNCIVKGDQKLELNLSIHRSTRHLHSEKRHNETFNADKQK